VVVFSYGLVVVMVGGKVLSLVPWFYKVWRRVYCTLVYLSRVY